MPEPAARPPARDDRASVLAALRDPEPAARPMMRWWWFGPDTDHATVERELGAMAAAGIGGAEVSLVYPLTAEAPDYLSPPVLRALRHAAEQARRLGLRLDLTLGSGWSFGGPHIGPEHASRRLRWERRDLGPQPLTTRLHPSWPGDEAVGAWIGEGFPPRDWRQLPLDGEEMAIPAGRGPRSVLIAWSETTGQQVKRAAAGAEGPVLDHLSAEATRHHLRAVGDLLLDAVPPELLGSVFCDSLEVYAAGWTAALPEEFAARRGYPLLPVLHRLQVEEPGSAELRADYARTLSELVEENFVQVVRDWAADRGVAFRLQGYGEPPITLSGQRRADLIEGEGCGWTGLPQSRWASSAAHLAGRSVVSSEVWTWVHSPSFRATPLDLLGEALEHLLLGITGFVGHGWPSSPAAEPGVGRTFYAAGALDDRNAWWPAMPELTALLTRLCAVMRRGTAAPDVLLVLPTEDVRAVQSGGHDLWRACRDRIDPAIPETIRRGGRDLDLVDNAALAELDPARAPVVVLPGIDRLPAASRAWLDAVRAAGGTVLTVGGSAYPEGTAVAPARSARQAPPSTVPSPEEATRPEEAAHPALAAALAAAAPAPLALSGGGGEVGVVRRRLPDGELFLLVNTGSEVRDLEVGLRDPRDRLELLDPAAVTTRALPDPATAALRLHPQQALLLLASDAEEAAAVDAAEAPATGIESEPAPPAVPVDGPVVAELPGPWTLTASGADPAP